MKVYRKREREGKKQKKNCWKDVIPYENFTMCFAYNLYISGDWICMENDNETHKPFSKIISDSVALMLISTNMNSFLEKIL